MPTPVRRVTYEDPFLNEMRVHPLFREFEKDYHPQKINGGECTACGAHVIENKKLHQEWHMKLNWAVWLMADWALRQMDRNAQTGS